MEGEKLLSPFAVALRQARLSKSLSISESMKATLLSDKQILGLENDDYSYFYNISYAAIAAETYAKFLGVDLTLEGAPSRDNMQSPRLVTSIDRGSTTKKRQRLFEGRYSPLFWFFLIVIFLLVYVIRSCEDREVSNQIIAVDDQLLQRRYPNEETLQEEAVIDATGASTSEAASVEWVPDVKAVPKPAISDPQPAIAPRSVKNDSQEWDRDAKENRFFIIINKQTWISAKDSLNKVLIEGTPQPTTGRRVIGKKPFLIVLEDPSAVEIYYLGSRIRPGNTGNPGISVVERT